MVQDTLLDSFRAGRRNYTIFQVGKATLLRVSDVMKLKKTDVFNLDVTVKQTAFIHDQKTGKGNTLYLKPVQQDLMLYHAWLIQQIQSGYFLQLLTQTVTSPRSNFIRSWHVLVIF